MTNIIAGLLGFPVYGCISITNIAAILYSNSMKMIAMCHPHEIATNFG